MQRGKNGGRSPTVVLLASRGSGLGGDKDHRDGEKQVD